MYVLMSEYMCVYTGINVGVSNVSDTLCYTFRLHLKLTIVAATYYCPQDKPQVDYNLAP